jgi:hypothetical protein
MDYVLKKCHKSFMNLFLQFLVVTMSLVGFSKEEDWKNFNSSFIIEVERQTGLFTCSGVAVSPKIILTAAHCLEGSIKSVRVFNHSRYNPTHKGLTISGYEIHPKYHFKSSRYQHDLAKIFLTEKISEDIKIYPVAKDNNVSGIFYRFGYGMRNNQNQRTLLLPKLRRLNAEEDVLELDDKFSKSGDSGGPIFIETENHISILAIHSTFSFGPEGNFSLNPLLSKERNWIFKD